LIRFFFFRSVSELDFEFLFYLNLWAWLGSFCLSEVVFVR
jgi:hypothetical protein